MLLELRLNDALSKPPKTLSRLKLKEIPQTEKEQSAVCMHTDNTCNISDCFSKRAFLEDFPKSFLKLKTPVISPHKFFVNL